MTPIPMWSGNLFTRAVREKVRLVERSGSGRIYEVISRNFKPIQWSRIMTFEGTVQGGVVVLEPGAQLAEGAEVNLHIYTASHQPATRYRVACGDVRPFWVKCPANRLYWCASCKKRRPARNLTVQVYYDGTAFWCRDGKGCKAPRSRKGRK